jgi:hypothetical protein
METSSANRFLTRSESGDAAFSQSGDEILCLHPIRVAANFFQRRQLPSAVFCQDKDNFRMSSGEKIEVANNTNMFPWFFQNISTFHFVQWLAQSRSTILPCWCRMKDLSVNRFLIGGENQENHRQNPGAGFVPSVASGSRRISCEVCRGRPPFPAKIPAMPKIISVRPALRESEASALKVFGEFHFDQGLIFKVVGFRQNGEMKCFDIDGETGRWFSRQVSATSVWPKAVRNSEFKGSFQDYLENFP